MTTAPLWQQPIEVLGLTGEYASGKSLFSLTIAPGPATLCYDNEKSSASYLALGFDRVDVPAELQKKFPNGYKPVDTFSWWLANVRSVPAGKYRVIVLDPVSEIESGLVDWVRTHPSDFGRTPAQYAKSAGLMWGDVKEHWKAILADLASRCETFAFTSHMTNIWERDGPTGKRKAKGKETLMELASLYLQLERKKDAKGNVTAKPAAVVLKSRLSSIRVNSTTGDVDIVPTLPPRLPEATPATVRRYMDVPPNYASLATEELAPETVLSEDEKLEIRNSTARAERETEEIRMARSDREREREQSRSRPTTQVQPPTTPVTATCPPAINGTPPAPRPDAVTKDQLTHLVRLRGRLWELAGDKTEEEKSARWKSILEKRGVKSALELSTSQATELIDALAERLNKEEPLDQHFRYGQPATAVSTAAPG